MFDSITGVLPTPILEYFITNAAIHANHTRQRNVPHVTQTFGTISERAVRHKGPKTWTEIPQTTRIHEHKNIFSRLLQNDYITKYNCITYAYNCWELSLFYLSVGVMHGCVVAVAVCVASRGWCAWVRLMCSCVCYLS